jgi:uncharacterized protein YdaT
MPWTLARHPPAMQHLPPVVRAKAIEIANAMLADGYEEGQAIRMAIAAAKRWAGASDDQRRAWLRVGDPRLPGAAGPDDPLERSH